MRTVRFEESQPPRGRVTGRPPRKEQTEATPRPSALGSAPGPGIADSQVFRDKQVTRVGSKGQVGAMAADSTHASPQGRRAPSDQVVSVLSQQPEL